MCCVSYRGNYDQYLESRCTPWEYDGPVSRDNVELIQAALESADQWIFFNAKRELHWFRRCGIIRDYHNVKPLWCCQVAEFIISAQREKYPSLGTSVARRNVGIKSDYIERTYWAHGIDTPSIPWDELDRYAKDDAELTYGLYEAQQQYLADKPELLQLIRLACLDLVVLAEMEYVGLILDTEECKTRSTKLKQEIDELDQRIKASIDVEGVNLNSPEHVSCVLYGGTLKYTKSVPYLHTYKTGPKAGETVTRFKHEKVSVNVPRLVDPLPKTALAKKDVQGKDILWSTDDGVLKRLRPRGRAKQVIELITKRNELERLSSTYYTGMPETIVEMDWEPNELHGQFNQCVVVTGRLSSSKPNLQNMPPEVNELIKTRF